MSGLGVRREISSTTTGTNRCLCVSESFPLSGRVPVIRFCRLGSELGYEQTKISEHLYSPHLS